MVFLPPNIEQKDTLSKRYDEDNYYDVVMANPPFKGSIDKGDINESFSLNTTKTELLFVNRIIKSLKIGGRAGVIVPEGVVGGDLAASQKIRQMIVEDNQLEAVISLPHFTFKPYASVATYILLFVKGGSTESVWMYNLEQDGYSKGNLRSFTGETDIPDLINNWNNRHSPEYKEVSKKHGFITKEAIVDSNYELSPKVLLKRDTKDKFPNQYVLLGEIADIEKGSESAQKNEIGRYPLITTAEEFKASPTYKYDEEAVFIPLVSSTGHGHASIKRLIYFNGKFSAASILAIVRIKDKDKFLPLFIYYYLVVNKDDLIVSLMKGAANVSLSIKKIQSIRIPILTIKQQQELIKNIVKIQDLIDKHKIKIKEFENEKNNNLSDFRKNLTSLLKYQGK